MYRWWTAIFALRTLTLSTGKKMIWAHEILTTILLGYNPQNYGDISIQLVHWTQNHTKYDTMAELNHGIHRKCSQGAPRACRSEWFTSFHEAFTITMGDRVVSLKDGCTGSFPSTQLHHGSVWLRGGKFWGPHLKSWKLGHVWYSTFEATQKKNG